MLFMIRFPQALAKAMDQQDKEAAAARRKAVDEEWYDVLADQRDHGKLDEWLAKAGSNITVRKVTTNPHSKPGQPLYNQFVTEWERIQDQTIKLCFHGTAEASPHLATVLLCYRATLLRATGPCFTCCMPHAQCMVPSYQ